ncbi:hypothetical protein [Botrimarina mediterranea]|uniref:Archaeal TRASH domain protein n=1 Tax=Botrimarina mediterranea TaxID=2528022 RepID=A0A518K7K9_9BACT|nr:hypothetical protein [Botrimarina mediterranea]QDV73788.1 Archaeal TRASH domain protein [Botrimarina mediterranea]QDV78434.1 Archaeal TRASH domain protein [Planctomycetes bacterium K2D]
MNRLTVFVAMVSVIALSHVATAQDAKEAAQLQKQQDKLRVAVQEICPVSGEKLGSMGEPLKVQVGEETVFLCCKGCAGKQVDPAHWATIHTNMAKAQGICPVMKKPLPEDAKSIVVNGQAIFICCPPCEDKITAEPEAYIEQVSALYTTSVRDQLRIAVQDICPVSGEKLGSMGEPLKVQVGEETVFLCCKGCMGKQIKREHWGTIHANFAKAQGICPVMGNDLPKTPKWTIVEGQVVYVCCPPCTKKLAAEPQLYLRKVDALYTAHLDKKAKEDSQRAQR